MLLETRVYVKSDHILVQVTLIADDEITHQARFAPLQLDAALDWANNVISFHLVPKIKQKLQKA